MSGRHAVVSPGAVRMAARSALAASVTAGLIAGCGGTTKTVVAASVHSGSLVASTTSLAAAQPPTRSTPWPGPSSSPKPAQGKKVFVLDCSNAAGLTEELAHGAAAAAKAMGWHATIGYGQLNPTVESSAITNAVLQGAQGIVTVCVTPAQVPSALRLAQSHHVPVIDASDIPDPGPLVAGASPVQWATDGDLVARWIINRSKGHARVVIVRADDLPGNKLRDDALVATLRGCSACKIVAQPQITTADALTPKIASLITALNSQYGDEMQYLVLPFGDAWPVAAPAIRALHRANLAVASFDGSSQEVQGCQQGLLQAMAVTDFGRLGWAAADQLNRVMQGQAANDDDTSPSYLVTGANCTSIPQGDDASKLDKYDYQAKFRSLWGTR